MRKLLAPRIVVSALAAGAAALGAANAQDADELKPVETKKGEEKQPTLDGQGTPPSKTAGDAAVVGSQAGSTRDPFKLDELTVRGDLPRNAASSDVVRARDFELRPIRTPADLLRLTPGLLTAQHQGGGKADQLFLRGFDADHGTDVALFVDGLPVNLRSHAHGQGWSDIHWVIPEFIDRVEVRKGTYYADLGDFATAGAVRLVTKDQVDGDYHVVAKAEAGFFDTGRLVLGVSPVKNDTTKTLVGGELYYTNGPTENLQHYDRGTFFAKGSQMLWKDAELSAWISMSEGDYHGSGQIPLRAVREHIIDEFGAIDPSEGGTTMRNNAHVQFRWMPTEDDLVQARVWGSQERLRLFSNFTLFRDDPVNGDEVEQVDQRWFGGGDFRFEHVFKIGTWRFKYSVGLETRTDVIDLKLAHAVQRQRLETKQAVGVTETSLSPWTELEVTPVKGLRFVGGVRDDHFWYTVRDHGGATTTLNGNRNDFVPQGKGGIVLGPFKSSDPESSTEFYADVGSGFHSNDARAVVQSNIVTLPQCVTYEVGFRSYLFDRLDIAADFFIIDLESELTFNGDDGTVSPSGRTRRIGGEGEVRLRIIDEWLWADMDLCYTEGRFTKDNSPIPTAPRLFGRAGLTLKTPVGFQASLQMRHIGRRPLGNVASQGGGGSSTVDAPAETIFDLMLRFIPVDHDNVEFFLRVENLFNANWREAQFFDTSQLRGESAPVGDIHFTPGVPASVFAGVQVKF